MLFSSYTVAPDFARALVMGLLGLGVSSVGGPCCSGSSGST